MDLYDNAVDVHETADILYKNGKFRMSVYNSCLAMELYLKAKLHLVEDGSQFEKSHDIVNVYRCLSKRFRPRKDLFKAINFGRKYFNESRYPFSGVEVYTEEFAAEFLGYVSDIRDFIDNDCIATLEDLTNKY